MCLFPISDFQDILGLCELQWGYQHEHTFYTISDSWAEGVETSQAGVHSDLISQTSMAETNKWLPATWQLLMKATDTYSNWFIYYYYYFLKNLRKIWNCSAYPVLQWVTKNCFFLLCESSRLIHHAFFITWQILDKHESCKDCTFFSRGILDCLLRVEHDVER